MLPDESKSENWKDGEVRYHVACHHFTEIMIREYLRDKKKWDWTELVSEEDAVFWLFELVDEDSSPIGYLKVQNVTKTHVKLFATTWVEEHPVKGSDLNDSNSKHSMMSAKSSTKSPKPSALRKKKKAEKSSDRKFGWTRGSTFNR